MTAAPSASPRARCTVLLVDDDATQLKLTTLRLRDAGFEVETASNAEEALLKAKAHAPDAVLSDVLMGDVDGFGLCRRLREEQSLATVPVLLLSAHYQSDSDRLLASRVGASALVMRTPEFNAELDALKSFIAAPNLPVTVTPDVAFYEEHLRSNANQLNKLLGQAKNAEERYRALFENASDIIGLLTPEGVILDVNERCQKVMGHAPAQVIGRHMCDFAAEGYEAYNLKLFQAAVSNGGGVIQALPLKSADGRIIYLDVSNTLIHIDGRQLMFSMGHDVTQRVLSTKSLAEAEQRYRSLVERIPDVIWTTTLDGQLSFVTPNVEGLFGFTVKELLAETLAERMEHVHPDDRDTVAEAFRGLSARGTLFDVEYRRLHKDGRWLWVRNRATAVYERDGVRYLEGMYSDITERKVLEDSVRQAQKMEAIGQLTGGIAHDFNNLLSVILANANFLLEDLATKDPRHTDAKEIKLAAERAAALTRQLLAFSRRQVLEPTIVDLNATVSGLERMLRRLIGEDVEFCVIPAAHLGSVRVDVGQLEQVIMNLVVNARDAMPTGGKLVIETANVELDESHTATHMAATPGHYVMLSVTDTGCGMDRETMRRVFEPFFTTKEPGKGTGLGLSTCYGIVKQSGGSISVSSDVGKGTVFKIYLPTVEESPVETKKSPVRNDGRGSETILLVEDDEKVRAAVTRMLDQRGYHLLVARDGTEGIDLARQYSGKIDLILSDVVMPGACGPEVVDAFQKSSGAVRALFMSGYTDHAMLRSEAIREGSNFIQKPFSPEVLARKIRDVLDAER